MSFQRIAIVGCGLIGGSFALGLKKHGFKGQISGCDNEKALEKARERGAIDTGTSDLAEAMAGADLVCLATPVIAILDRLPQVAKSARPGSLVTDVGSTKVRICRLAKEVLPESVTFLGGHPMAGREAGGIENANADLLVGAKYVLVGEPQEEFVGWLQRLGAEPVFMDAETHDWAVALVSHLPQLVSTALASATWDETDEDGLPLSLAGPGFRDLTRLAASPYDLWRDICLTNGDNIGRALERLEQRLEHIRTLLRSKDLAEEFEKAQQTCAMLKRGGANE